MALTVDTIRNFAGASGIQLDQQNGGLQTASKLQRFKSFFGFGDARQRNAETLTAIHHAIINDPRFFAKDVQAEAVRLLGQVRTDRAIGAAEIKSIIDHLDKMSTDPLRRSVARDLLGARIADRGLPAGLPDSCRAGYARLAKEDICRNEPAHGWASLDYGAALDQFDAHFTAFFSRIPDAHDKELVGTICGKAMRAPTFGLHSDSKLQTIADGFVANFDEGRALEAELGTQYREKAEELIVGMEKPIIPAAGVQNPLHQLVEGGRRACDVGIRSLDGNSSGAAINDVLVKFCEVTLQAQQGLGLDEPGQIMGAQDFSIWSAVQNLSQEERDNLLAALESKAGRNLIAFYNTEGQNSHAQSISACLERLYQNLKPGGQLDVPSEPDMTLLPARVLAQFSPASLVSGDASGSIKAQLEKQAVIGENPTSATVLRAKVNDAAKAMTITNIALQIARECRKNELDATGKVISSQFSPDFGGEQFDKDLDRDFVIQLPNGETLPKNPQVARDKILQFVTGNSAARFAEADTASKMKVLALMTCLNQSVPGIGISAFSECVNGNPKVTVGMMGTITDDSYPNPCRFTLRKDSNGDVLINFTGRRHVKALMLATGPSNGPIMLKSGSYDECEVNIRFPAADLDRFGSADWEHFDYSEVVATERKHNIAQAHHAAVNLMDEALRFTGSVSVANHMHLVTA